MAFRLRPRRLTAWPVRFVLAGLACLWATGPTAAAPDVPGDAPPAGYHLVAEDNCGTPGQTHVVVGTSWLYPADMVDASVAHRAIVFDNAACVLRYYNPKPNAEYSVEVVYVDNGGRVQRLSANGHEVHAAMALPVRRPHRYVFPIPKAAYADGQPIALEFGLESGANAIVSMVRIWSTDKARLGAPPPSERAAFRRPAGAQPAVSTPLWEPDDPVLREWMHGDSLVRRAAGEGWEDEAAAVQRCLLPAVDKHLRRAYAIARDVRRLGVDVTAALQALDAAAARRDALAGAGAVDPAAGKALWLDVRRVARELAFAHPRLHGGDGLLLVRGHHPVHAHQCARRRARYLTPGGDVCVLSDIRPDGTIMPESLTEGRLPPGIYSRPDVSFDGTRILFGYSNAAEKDVDEPPCESRGTGDSIGNGTFFHVWEMPADGSTPPRRITHGTTRRSESTDPIYLPGGRIAFMSPQVGGMVMCGDWAWADCMFSVNADGTDTRQITQAKEGEWDPALLDDGSIAFTRWEYVMRFWRPTQLIWNVRPDGTNPRVIGGYLVGERNYARCRQIPGTTKVVCVESHHHNDGSGNILSVDLAAGRDTPRGERLILSGAADCPFPLDENYFLVSYDPQGTGARDNRAGGRLDLYLADVYGGVELVYRDPGGLSALYPMLLAPRPEPRRLPETGVEAPSTHAAMVVQDVHRGLPDSMRDKARHIRVVEVHERHIHTSPCNIWVGMGGFETKTVLGRVPVEPDGSAYFRVPAGKPLFLSVLDEDGLALHTMRMTTQVKPGESVGCVGCHEPMRNAPPVGRALSALKRPASTIEPPPWGVETFGFPKHVQPILVRHCVACHDGTKGDEKSFDLMAGADVSERFVPNLWTVTGEGYRAHYTYQSYWALLPHVKYASVHQYETPPGSWGSRVSPLVKLLAKGHKDVKLSPADWRTLTAWIDCNVPYLDDYRKFAVDPAIRAGVNTE